MQLIFNAHGFARFSLGADIDCGSGIFSHLDSNERRDSPLFLQDFNLFLYFFSYFVSNCLSVDDVGSHPNLLFK